MKTAIFKRNDARAYYLSCLLGVVSGLMLFLLDQYGWADIFDTFPAWFFGCALIALYSDDNGTAGIHTAIYALCLLDTPILCNALWHITHGDSFVVMLKQFPLALSVGIVAAVVCYALAFIMNFGRRANIISLILRFLPAVLMAYVVYFNIIRVLTYHAHYLKTMFQGACIIVYVMLIVMTMVFEKIVQKKKEAENYGIYGTV